MATVTPISVLMLFWAYHGKEEGDMSPATVASHEKDRKAEERVPLAERCQVLLMSVTK